MNISIPFLKLPFSADERQIIYVENEYNESVNLYIQDNYQNIIDHFSSNGFKFCYIPTLLEELKNPEVIRYHAPYLSKDFKPQSIKVKSDFIFQWLHPQYSRNAIKPSLLYYDRHLNSINQDKDVCFFRDISISYSDLYQTNNLSNVLNYIIEDIGFYKTDLDESDLFHRAPEYMDISDYDAETQQVIIETRENINRLQKSGIELELIMQLIQEKPIVSKLRISEDFTISLPDYGISEIELTAQPKAFYFLCLLHPEGIVLKDAMKHKDELYKIYQIVKKAMKIENDYPFVVDEAPVTNVLDCTKNSNNVVINKIKSAFNSVIASNLANYYIVQKDADGIYRVRVSLDDNLLEWDNTIEFLSQS